MESLVFTIIGNDRPGLIEKISTIVNRHSANWLGSSMAQLGGKFAGMIEVAGEVEQLSQLRDSLEELNRIGLTLVIEKAVSSTEHHPETQLISLFGLDRPGIIQEISSALAAKKFNILDLKTEITKAAMTGDPMFNGQFLIEDTNLDQSEGLTETLEKLSIQLDIDIELATESTIGPG
ncbi:MAG: glycine cleavage system protein R [Gammaproteobacteria bacterium]|jgi:glycine cleavage system regulatory protein|nr:glycine cleavage system protein R [Gammaproteobacteria bacterium]MBT5603656.1 glycine cleavage system protein R [Gammaproteobacteria bacterium]MBT6246447.1 glycine cleavage system protein R [Gammaproteobacteria bacterium]